MLADEIRLLQKTKPDNKKHYDKIEKLKILQDKVFNMEEDALLKLYDMYKVNLRTNCQTSMFVEHPGIAYLMKDIKPLTEEIKMKMIEYFKNDGILACDDYNDRPPYIHGFKLQFIN